MTLEQDQQYHAWRSVIEPQPMPGKGAGHAMLAELEVVNPYSLMALGKDLSHWSPDDDDIEGYDFLIFKIGGSENAREYGNPYLDDKFLYWIDKAYKVKNPQGGLGVPVLVYFMNNPRVYLDNQMTKDNVLQCSEATHPILSMVFPALHNGASWKYQIYGWYNDIEEASYWSSRGYTIPEMWQQFMEDELRTRFVHKIKANESPYPFPKMHLGTYSRRSFLLQHFNPGPHGENDYSIMSYIRDHPEMKTWPANYPRKVPNVSCAEIREKWLPEATWIPYKLFDEVDELHPTHAKPWDIWQFAGEPDLNLWNGTPREMYAEIGFTPRPEPVTPPPVVTVKMATIDQGVERNFRGEPVVGNNILPTMPSILTGGFTSEVLDTVVKSPNETWIKVCQKREGWIAARFNGVDYVTYEDVKA